MGAWGHQTFQNDDALDWLVDLEECDDTSVIDEVLDEVLDEILEAEEYIEAPECSRAVAAAEMVAALDGMASASLPEGAKAWLEGKPRPEGDLIARARRALDAILADSELRALWEESEDYPHWTQDVERVRTRLLTSEGQK